MNIYLAIGLIFIITFSIGKLLEKIKIPWIFASLLFGASLAVYDPFPSLIQSEIFDFFAKLGMYFLLFLIGIELDFEKIKNKSSFIIRTSFCVIAFECALVSLIIHYLFGYEWIISILVGLSFATVGEAILVPILQEFRLVNTKLGQAVIGIGTFDDLFEIIVLIFAGILIGEQTIGSISLTLGSLILLGFFLANLFWLHKVNHKFRFKSIETLFLIVLFEFFVFVGVGAYADAAPLAALLAGIGIRLFVPAENFQMIESEIKSLAYGFFAPIFFVQVGSALDFHYLISSPLFILLIIVVSSSAKLLASFFVTRKELNVRDSIVLGIGLSVRFSTSIIVVKFLFDNGLIKEDLYSIIVASSIIFSIVIPVLFSQLVKQWKES